MQLTLRDSGFQTFKKICQGKKWVGRVVRCADGRFLGIVNTEERGKVSVYAASEAEAFRQVCAKAFGFDSPADLLAHNAQVRAKNREKRAAAHYAVDQAFNHRNFEPFLNILSRS